MNPFDQFDTQQINPFDQFDGGAQPKPVNQDLGAVHGLTSGFAQGATFGLGDEAISGVAALRSAYDKGSLSDVSNDYNQALGIERGAEKNFSQQHPVLSIGSQLAGGLATGLAGGQTATGRAVASSLGEGSLPARMLKNAAVGATSGGLYGLGSGEGGFENRLQSGEQGALVGGAVGAAVPAVGAAYDKLKGGIGNIAQGIKAQDAEELSNTIDQAHAAASPYYQQMRKMGDTLTPNATGKVLGSIKNALSDPENEYIPELSSKTTTIIKALQNKADNGSIGVSTLDQYMRKLQRVVGDPEDSFSAGVAKKAIWKTLNDLSGEDLASGSTDAVQLLNKARETSAKAFRYESVANVLQKANGDPNRIKAGLSRFVANDDNLNGFNQTEKDALREAANTNLPENIFKALGKFGFDFSKSGTGNTVLPILSGAAKAGGAALIPHGAPIVAGGTVARQAFKYGARGKAENALQTILNRGPQQIPSVAAGQSFNPLALGFGIDAGAAPNLFEKMRVQ